MHLYRLLLFRRRWSHTRPSTPINRRLTRRGQPAGVVAGQLDTGAAARTPDPSQALATADSRVRSSTCREMAVARRSSPRCPDGGTPTTLHPDQPGVPPDRARGRRRSCRQTAPGSGRCAPSRDAPLGAPGQPVTSRSWKRMPPARGSPQAHSRLRHAPADVSGVRLPPRHALIRLFCRTAHEVSTLRVGVQGGRRARAR